MDRNDTPQTFKVFDAQPPGRVPHRVPLAARMIADPGTRPLTDTELSALGLDGIVLTPETESRAFETVSRAA